MQDGFSDEWGFSLSDIAANLTGSLLFVAQQYGWGDQRFMLKISAWPEKYPADQKERARQLYGASFGEQLLKDYNANTFWLSVSPGAFIKSRNQNSRNGSLYLLDTVLKVCSVDLTISGVPRVKIVPHRTDRQVRCRANQAVLPVI